MIDELKQWEYDKGYEKGKADMMAMLDKIRDEIEELADADGYGDYQLGFSFGLMMAMEIIDKHKAESEDKE